MPVEVLEEHDRGGPLAAPVQDPWLLALPRKYPVACAIAWTILLLGLTLAPQRILPDEKTFLTKRPFVRVDLVIHFTLFVGFAWSWIRATRPTWRWVVVAATGLFLAVWTEWTQGFSFIDRDPDLTDVLGDGAGGAAGRAGGGLCRGRTAAGATGRRGPTSRAA